MKESDKKNEIDKLKKDYEKYLKKFDLDAKGIELRLEIKTVAEYLLGDNDRYLPQEIIEDKAAQAIHFIGVLIVFEKKKN